MTGFPAGTIQNREKDDEETGDFAGRAMVLAACSTNPPPPPRPAAPVDINNVLLAPGFLAMREAPTNMRSRRASSRSGVGTTRECATSRT